MRPLPSDRPFAAERAEATSAGAFDTPVCVLLREQVRRFVAREVEPQAATWERAGSIPRDVLRRLGALGWIRHRLALLDARTRAVQSYAWHCAWLAAQGRDCVREISGLKALAGELANDVAHACQQFHGEIGYIRKSTIERLWRDARILAIGGGATEVMLEEATKRL